MPLGVWKEKKKKKKSFVSKISGLPLRPRQQVCLLRYTTLRQQKLGSSAVWFTVGVLAGVDRFAATVMYALGKFIFMPDHLEDASCRLSGVEARRVDTDINPSEIMVSFPGTNGVKSTFLPRFVPDTISGCAEAGNVYSLFGKFRRGGPIA